MDAHERRARLVVVASSTGGPDALAQLMPSLPAPLGLGTLLVQHMPPGFTSTLAARLDRASPLAVREARDGDLPDPGAALLAPAGRHLRLTGGGSVALTTDGPVAGHRPNADVTVGDAVAVYGERVLLVVLTGMGRDGLAGARAVRENGGRVLVESESTAAVYGMPRWIAEAGLADLALPLPELASVIVSEANGDHPSSPSGPAE